MPKMLLSIKATADPVQYLVGTGNDAAALAFQLRVRATKINSAVAGNVDIAQSFHEERFALAATCGATIQHLKCVACVEAGLRARMRSPMHGRFIVSGQAPQNCWAGTVSASDRKSTRLNSSHVAISYAVFCLKKKI